MATPRAINTYEFLSFFVYAAMLNCRYRNQTQLLDVARGYAARQLPVSVIVIYWQHWAHQGDWEFNPRCWPDPQGMFDELQTMGIDLMVTFWPFQATDSKNWKNFSSNGYVRTRGKLYLCIYACVYVYVSSYRGNWVASASLTLSAPPRSTTFGCSS